MKKIISLFFILVFCLASNTFSQNKFTTDSFSTSQGDLEITFIGHGSLMFNFNGLIIQVDPWSKLADYSKLPKADIILITHQHQDHFDPKAISELKKEYTKIVCPQTVAESLKEKATVMKNGDFITMEGIEIVAVPAYNLVHKRKNGEFYHPKGVGNGYVLRFGDKKVYVAGDTENIPEMKNLKNIDIAFLPMNLPYTMTPQMVVDAVRMIRPKILYPYHYGNTNANKLLELLKGEDYCEVRVRNMK